MRISDWSSDVCSSDLARLTTRANSKVRIWIAPIKFIRGQLVVFSSIHHERLSSKQPTEMAIRSPQQRLPGLLPTACSTRRSHTRKATVEEAGPILLMSHLVTLQYMRMQLRKKRSEEQ